MKLKRAILLPVVAFLLGACGTSIPESASPSASPSETSASESTASESEIPSDSEEPSISEEPSVSDEPSISDEPSVSDEPSTSDEPSVPEPTLSSISVTSNPTKTSYSVGDALNLSGLVVTGTFSDSSQSDVTSLCTVSPASGYIFVSGDVGTKTITVSHEGVSDASFSVTVSQVELKSFSKVTSALNDYSGTYLIVYDTDSLAFDGSLAVLDAVSDTKAVTISSSSISASVGYAFTIAKSESTYTIKSASGYYIGQTATDANGLLSSTTVKYSNTITYDTTNSCIDIVSSGNAHLRYNSTSGQTRFRYYKSSSYTNQKVIQLYRAAD